MVKPTVSIVVPCYNQSCFLPETLDSVINQTYVNWECIIVNDGSTDDTIKVSIKYTKLDSRIKYIEQTNRGVASARNKGIANAKGEFILPLDADDKIAPEYLKLAIRQFENCPMTKLVYCEAMTFSSGGAAQKWDLPSYNYENLLWSNSIFVSAIFRKRDFVDCGGFDEALPGLEDWDFWLSFLKKEDIVYRIPMPLFYYRQNLNGRNHRANEIEIVKKTYENIVEKHKDIYEPFFKELLFTKMSLYDKLDTLERIYSSKEYCLGNMLLHPSIRNIRKFFEVES